MQMNLRKLIAVFATLLLVIGMLPLSLAVSAADVGSFDFEDGAIPTGWKLDTAGASGVDTVSAKDGNYGFHISGAAWAEILTTASFELKDDVVYTISFDIKAAGNGGQYNLQVKNPSVPEKPGAGSNIVMAYPTLPTDWTTVSYTVSKSEDYPNGYFSILFVSQGADFYLDNVTITANGPTVNNDVLNGDFETGDGSDWVVSGGVVELLDGDYALKATTSSRYDPVAEQIISVEPNKDYTLTVSTKYVGAYSKAQARVHVYKGATGTNEALDGAYYWYIGANTWETKQLAFNPGDNTQVRILIQQHAAPDTSTAMDGSIYYDDFVVAEVGAEPGYTGVSQKELTSGADIRVMSYNTLVDNDEPNGGWSWGQPIGKRPEKAAAAIAYYLPDVIGFQENNYNWHIALRELLPNYDYVNADVPEVQKLEAAASLGKKDWMCTTMMYNTDTLELVENELIGYSVNYWGCIQRMRYISMALFKVKKTGEMFVFTSTHFDAEQDTKGQRMRKTQAGELAERINYYKDTYGCPIISTGDYNSGYNDEPIALVRETAGMDSYSGNRGGIDYILYSEGVECKYFTVVNDADLNGASDHQPIFGDFSLQDGFSFHTSCAKSLQHNAAVASTCQSEGVAEHWICTVCGKYWSDAAATQETNAAAVVLPAAAHTIVHFAAVEPGCHYNGNIEYWFCSACEGFWQDEALTQVTNSKNVIVPAKGGEVVAHEAIAPGCHYDGQIAYWYCAECDQFWQDEALTQITNVKNVVLPATGSDKLQHVEAKAATATENGNIEYWFCPDCEQYWQDAALTQLTNSKNVIIAATGAEQPEQPEQPEEPGSPETGDSPVPVVIALLTLIASGVAVALLNKKRA